MSILIKGMEMPEDIEPGLVIEFANNINGKRYARLYHYRHGGLTEWLEVISVPPHGRLIDADRLKADNPRHMNLDVPYVTEVTVEEIIDEAPTIIEAEEGK